MTAAEDLVVCVVVGLPSGAHESQVKAAEAALAVTRGATEVDMVIDLGSALAGDWGAVAADVAAVEAACGSALLKVIVESATLTPEQLEQACRRSEAGGAQYVKTSTGFHPAGGASVKAVRIMRETVGDRLGVEASGGIRDTATALAMLEAGTSRSGVSGTRAVLAGLPLARPGTWAGSWRCARSRASPRMPLTHTPAGNVAGHWHRTGPSRSCSAPRPLSTSRSALSTGPRRPVMTSSRGPVGLRTAFAAPRRPAPPPVS